MQEFLWYGGASGDNSAAEKRASGAYIFRPDGPQAYAIPTDGIQTTIYIGSFIFNWSKIDKTDNVSFFSAQGIWYKKSIKRTTHGSAKLFDFIKDKDTLNSTGLSVPYQSSGNRIFIRLKMLSFL